MRRDLGSFDTRTERDEAEGGVLGLALLAVAVGAGTALLFAPSEGAKTRKLVGRRLRGLRGDARQALVRLQRELDRRDARRRRERRSAALMGLAVGAGLAAVLLPQSGPETRRSIAARLRRRAEETAAEVDRVVREPQPEPAL